MTSMTQIQQYYQTENKHRSKSNQNSSIGSHKKLDSPRQAAAPIKDSEDKWLDEPLDVEIEPAAHLDVAMSLVNIDSVFLRSILAGKKMGLTLTMDEERQPEVKMHKSAETDNDEDYLIQL
ncbi:hypothetical protein H0H92_001869 [Tricholoma furcatifolium]|nr:hypothetical protein H0H92_001869 [Tricholoma furcatifolium]